MSLIFSVGEYRAMSRREFYRIALRAILLARQCTAAHEERLILELRREEAAGC